MLTVDTQPIISAKRASAKPGTGSVDVELLRRYETRGPRYTSYPAAPAFSKDYGSKDFELDLIRNNHENETGISLYINIPFCDTLCYFCGCTTVVTPNHGHAQKYIQYLKKEIRLFGRYIPKSRKVVQLQWGGGTPTYLWPEEIYEITDTLREVFTFDEDMEAGVEIDPRGLEREQLEVLRKAGFNRLSLGVQDFDENVQHAVNRIQSEELVRKVMGWARDLGFGSINVDLIYGLPLQTVETFSKTIDTIIDLDPARLAVYNYAHVPWLKPHQRLLKPEDLPNADEKIKILAMTVEKLTAAGYVYIGMDHFAKADDELATAREAHTLHRNFQGYSTKAGVDQFALGMASISHFGGTYAQNEKTLTEYYKKLDQGSFATHIGHRMTKDDSLRAEVISKLMCDGVLVKRDIEDKYDIQFDEYFDRGLERLQECVRDGLVTHTVSEIRVMPQGWFFLRNIAMCFDAYLEEFQKHETMFSKTV